MKRDYLITMLIVGSPLLVGLIVAPSQPEASTDIRELLRNPVDPLPPMIGTPIRINTEALQEIKQTIEEKKIPQSPVEMTPVSVSSPDSAVTPGDTEDTIELWVSCLPLCPPCYKLKQDIAAGKWPGYKFNFVGDFPGRKTFPAFRFKDSKSVTGYAVAYGYNDKTLPGIRQYLKEQQR